MDKWGAAILGSEPDFKTVVKAHQALGIHNVFEKDHTKRTQNDWKLVKRVLSEIEGWDNGG